MFQFMLKWKQDATKEVFTMTRHITILILLAVLIVGCASGPGTKTPTEPEDLFTGEPTAALIEVQRQVQSPPPASMSLMSATSDDDENDTLTANILLQRRTPAGHVDFERFFSVPVPHDATSVELPVEVPADKGYRVHVDIYDPNNRSKDNMLYMIETGTESDIGVMANSTNTMTVQMGPIGYTFTAPDELYSGGSFNQFSVILDEYDPDIRIYRMYGLNPWDGNGIRPFWDANGGNLGLEIPDTGWLNSGRVPNVDEPTLLYYQIAICAPIRLADGGDWICHYDPNIEAGERLHEVTVYPEPDDF